MKKQIPFHKPFELPLNVYNMIHKHINLIFKSGKLTNDTYTALLEKGIKDRYNVDYVIATSSCTMGLMICLSFLENRYINVPMFEWWSVLYILTSLRKQISWIDIDLDTWLPNGDSKYGYNLYLNTFGNIGKSRGEETIYDSSHCLGGKIEHFGLAHVFSLAPTKLVTSCEGGIIITNNKDLYEFAFEYRNKIARMSEIHALIGSIYIKYIDKILLWKKEVRDYYEKHIPGTFQEIPNNSTHNTIGFLNINNLKIPEHIEIKQYYEPIDGSMKYIVLKSNTKTIYEQIICLPSYYNCPYEKIVNDILEVNKL